MAQKKLHSTTARKGTDQTARDPRHAQSRDDRRRDREERREATVIVLHPALFERQLGVAA